MEVSGVGDKPKEKVTKGKCMDWCCGIFNVVSTLLAQCGDCCFYWIFFEFFSNIIIFLISVVISLFSFNSININIIFSIWFYRVLKIWMHFVRVYLYQFIVYLISSGLTYIIIKLTNIISCCRLKYSTLHSYVLNVLSILSGKFHHLLHSQ